jgi:TolB-like protein
MRSTFDELSRRRVLKVAAVYVAIAWGATEILGFLLPALNFPPWTVTIIALLFILGFPVAMFLSWIFDIQADGIRRTSPASGRGRLTIFFALIFLIVGTAGLFHLIYPGSAQAPGGREAAAFNPPDNSVAVLPFVNMSEDPENTYFGDGIAEELLHRLARNTGLLVTARTSSFQFRDKLLDVRKIGEQLNVANILEGSIRKSGNRIRVTVQLVNTRDGYHDWSETYDRELTDIFAVQDEIAASVGDTLAKKIVVAARGSTRPTERPSETTDIDQYDAYLRARYLLQQGSAPSTTESIAILEQVVSSSPEFSQAWLSLAEAYALVPGRAEDSDEMIREAAGKALTLDPALGTAHALIADVAMRQWEWLEAEQGFRRALSLEPGSADVMVSYASMLVKAGRIQDAHDLLRRAMALDPLSASTRIALARVLMIQGNTEAALHTMATTNQSTASDTPAGQMVVLALLRQQRFDEAWSLADQQKQDDERNEWFWPDFVINALADPRERSTAAAKLASLVAVGRFPAGAALLYQGWLGDWNAAYESSLKCVEQRSCMLEELWYEELSEFRRDPRFLQFAASTGLRRNWKDFGYPDSCLLRDNVPDCG